MSKQVRIRVDELREALLEFSAHIRAGARLEVAARELHFNQSKALGAWRDALLEGCNPAQAEFCGMRQSPNFIETLFMHAVNSSATSYRDLEAALDVLSQTCTQFAKILLQEAGHTAGIRAQFLLITLLVPLTALMTFLVVPDLMQISFHSGPGQVSLLASGLLYFSGITCFLRLQNRVSCGTLLVPRSGKWPINMRKKSPSTQWEILELLVHLKTGLRLNKNWPIILESWLMRCQEHESREPSHLQGEIQEFLLERKTAGHAQDLLQVCLNRANKTSRLLWRCLLTYLHDAQGLASEVSRIQEDLLCQIEFQLQTRSQTAGIKLLAPIALLLAPSLILYMLAPIISLFVEFL